MFNQFGLTLSALLMLAISVSVIATPTIENQRNCFRGVFGSHQSWLESLQKNKTNFNRETFLRRFPEHKFNQHKATLDCVDFTYRVDDLTVEGYYLKPKKPQHEMLPVVIYNRGGNSQFGRVNFGEKMSFIADIASAGYVVIGSQYRGSSRYIDNNGQDEFGGADVKDITSLVELLPQIPAADATKLAMIGWSRGVNQSYQVAKQLPELKGIIAIAGNSDAAKSLAWRPAMEKVYAKRIPNFATHRDAALKQRSVIYWAEELPANAPILLIHGDADKRVNVEQSKTFAQRLSELNRPHKLVIYRDGNHSLTRHREALRKESINWLSAVFSAEEESQEDPNSE